MKEVFKLWVSSVGGRVETPRIGRLGVRGLLPVDGRMKASPHRKGEFLFLGFVYVIS